MAMDQVRIRRSLYAGLHRTVFRFGLLIAAAWLFALFSYYLSMKTNADWFTRSGAVMGLSAAAVTFRLTHFYQRALATALKEGLVSVQRGIELRLEPLFLSLQSPQTGAHNFARVFVTTRFNLFGYEAIELVCQIDVPSWHGCAFFSQCSATTPF